ncbi:MAG: diphosphomevalonate decarboxylase [Candidatus Bathyarchaeota archaeon]|nr:MAG: diphosphomevalonate decarboxylase [Candidatus Bathyarchaeota archaeon]
MKSSAIAHSNIALIKYWGRSLDHNPNLNIPSNDSVSMTKYGLTQSTHLQTHTTIDFSDAYQEDSAILEEKVLARRKMERILKVVDPLRKYANIDCKFKMMSRNDFPTQAGLASSASGFAALAIAAANALGIDFTKEEISTFARLGSGSATRSIQGGFVRWKKGNSHETSFAEQICDPHKFNMNAVIAIVHEGKKDVTSDVGHESAHTSPFNEVRILKSQQQAKDIQKAILDDDFCKVGRIAEESSKYMHAVMMTSNPPLFYWHPSTLRLVRSIQEMRKRGMKCYFTVDAGPNVHCLCRPEDRYELQKMLGRIEYIKKIIPVKPADDSYVTKEHLF